MVISGGKGTLAVRSSAASSSVSCRACCGLRVARRAMDHLWIAHDPHRVFPAARHRSRGREWWERRVAVPRPPARTTARVHKPPPRKSAHDRARIFLCHGPLHRARERPFRRSYCVSDMSFTVNEGELVSLIGPNARARRLHSRVTGSCGDARRVRTAESRSTP